MDKQVSNKVSENEVADKCFSMASTMKLVGLFELLIEIDRQQKSNKQSYETQNNGNTDLAD
ncbi:MAG: hypothetical protein Q8P62_05470 [Candidatus Peregrinibacteria bacterium]|nr:hypothetical protein [Candidatus Peregrinibacteria bacterium]